MRQHPALFIQGTEGHHPGLTRHWLQSVCGGPNFLFQNFRLLHRREDLDAGFGGTLKAYEEELGHIHSVVVHPNRASEHPTKRLIYIPWMSGTADHSVELLEGLDGVESFAMSLRGRGKSKAPDSKFTFDAQVSDVSLAVCEKKKIPG